jgi:signal peptidase I
VTQVAPSAPPVANPPERPRRSTWLRDTLEVLLIALILYLVIANALQTVRVDGQSMVGSLNDQDLLLASKVSYDFGGNPQRGDIVVLMPPFDQTKDFIKRVIGLPGDVIEIDGRKPPTRILIKPGGQGAFQLLKEPYLPEPWTNSTYCCRSDGTASSSTPNAVRVPKDDYFVMGDNRNFSSDSRSFGWVPRKNILAKAFLRIWPLNHFGGLGSGPSFTAVPTPAMAVPAVAIAGLVSIRRRRRRRAA